MTQDRPMKVTVHGAKTLWSRGPFSIFEYHTTNERYRGGDNEFRWISFERGDAMAVILYKSDTREVILVRQFRAPTLRLGSDGVTPQNDGQLDETIAGMPMKGESYRECAAREVAEEARYRVPPGRLEKIAQFYASPGGTSEVIHLFFAEVTDADRMPGSEENQGGVGDEEDMLVKYIPVSDFLGDIEKDVTVDSKIVIASMLLRDRLRDVPEDELDPAPNGRVRYELTSRPGRAIILRTGNIRAITDVDIWVNPENTDMEMDRYTGHSVSALIRYLGAEKDDDQRVTEDAIANALRKRMRTTRNSRIGTVHDTTSGMLKRTHNVERVFHVATLAGVAGDLGGGGASAEPRHVHIAAKAALEAIDRRNGKLMFRKHSSALLPMIGGGDQGLAPEIAFPKILQGAIDFFEERARTDVTEIHLSAFTKRDADVAMAELDKHAALRRIG